MLDPATNSDAQGIASGGKGLVRTAVATGLAGLLAAHVTPASAVDGCLVLLCLAAPSWRAIPRCVPPVSQVLRDLMRGRAFPTCAMAGAGNSATHAWASAPVNCPPQYTMIIEGDSTREYRCMYSGVISVNV